MRFWLFYFFMTCIIAAPVYCQKTDSLEKNIRSKVALDKALAIMEAADYLSYYDTALALKMLHRARPIVKGNDLYEAIYVFYNGSVYFDFDQPKCQDLSLQACRLLEKQKGKLAYKYLAKSWYHYGAMLQWQDRDEEFLRICLEKSIPYASLAQDTVLIANYRRYVGMVFYNQKNYDMAIANYKIALSMLQEAHKSSDVYFSTLLSLTEVYLYKYKADSANHYLSLAEQFLKSKPESVNGSWYYIIRSKYFRLIEKPDKAAAAIDSGMNYAQMHHQKYDSATFAFEKFHLLKMTGRLREAKQLLLALLNDSMYANLSKNRLSLMFEHAQLEYALGNFKEAANILLAYKSDNDTLTAAGIKERIAKLDASYRMAEKEKAIEVLTANANALQKKRQSEFLLWLMIVGLLATVVIIYVLQSRNRKKLMTARELTYQAEMQNIQQQKKTSELAMLLQGQNQERERIARDLHDGLGGLLSGIKLSLSAAESNKNYSELLIKKTIDRLDSAVVELRHVSNNLSPQTLLKQGLEPALRQYAHQIKPSDCTIDIQFVNFKDGISNHRLLSLYRIMQELLANAVKHAKASYILLQVQQSEQQIFITIEDDGIGFDISSISAESKGIGNIKQRVSDLNGTLEIHSNRQDGSTINIAVPAE